jgi:hypothetical protein
MIVDAPMPPGKRIVIARFHAADPSRRTSEDDDRS